MPEGVVAPKPRLWMHLLLEQGEEVEVVELPPQSLLKSWGQPWALSELEPTELAILYWSYHLQRPMSWPSLRQ